MTDKELLKNAAKAADYGFTYKRQISDETHEWVSDDGLFWQWNPLMDDGQALRLAVKLGLAVMPYPLFEAPKHAIVVSQRNFEHSRYEACELYEETDPYAATRRAIVRAAAEIGKTL